MANQNIYALFETRFPAERSQTVLETDAGVRYGYADLDRESARYAALLQAAGVRPGDRVAVQVEKSPQALFLYLGCLRAGFVYLPLNTAYTAAELAYFLGDAEPAAVVCDPAAAEGVGKLAGAGTRVYTLGADGSGSLTAEAAGTQGEFQTARCGADDLAVILYTSGTTGKPKGAMITHRNLAANAEALREAWGFTAGDVLLHALPLFHIHGLFVACHPVLLSGARLILLPRFSVDAVLAHLPAATVFMGVPTYYTRLLADPRLSAALCRGMRLFTSGSAPLLEQTFHAFEQRSGHTILERYGMTETGMNTSNPLHGPRRPGTVGPPLPGVSVRVVDEADRPLPAGETGRLQVRGDNVFKGYWRLPDKTAEEFTADGWFKTGDLARIDADGYVSIVGRDKDMVISGGYNVYPKEIETAIDAMDGVLESAVIGLPHPDFGEGVTAVVVPAPGARAPTEAGIIATLKQTLANYKVPKRVFFVDSLPRNTMGKVQKNVLRERFERTYSS